MYCSSLNRLIAKAALCSLLLQGCRSNLRAIIEEPALKGVQVTAGDRVQESGEASSSGTLASLRTDACVDGMLAGMSLAEPVAAAVSTLATVPRFSTACTVVNSVPRSFAGPFTTFSGERVLFDQCRGQWQAVLAPGSKFYGYERMLPVVGSGDTGALLAELQGQDAWLSRSRIHVLSAPHTSAGSCVYVGKLGLLGGAPTQQTQSPAGEWRVGPMIILGSNDTKKEIYRIPSGYRYKGYRLREGSVIQRASLTINYVAAHNERRFRKLASAKDSSVLEGKPGTKVGQIVTLDKLEGGASRLSARYHEDGYLQRTRHVGLVLHGNTSKNSLFCQSSKIDVQVEVFIERMEDDSSDNLHDSSLSVEDTQEDMKPPAKTSRSEETSGVRAEVVLQGVDCYEEQLANIRQESIEALRRQAVELSLNQTLSAEERVFLETLHAEVERDCENKLISIEEALFRIAYSKSLLQQHGEQTRVEVASKDGATGLDTQREEEETSPSRAMTLPQEVFGAKEWSRYFGEVGEEPFLPSDIDEILNGPCPFWEGKVVKDTHLLVLIPSTVSGKPFTLDLFGELVKRPKGGGRSTKYRFYDSDIQAVLGTRSPGGSYWILMTRDVIEGSRSKRYAIQKALIAAHARETGLPYVLPSALEAATAILSHYVRSGERLYTDAPWTYTRCQELINNEYPVIVGGFSLGGLAINYFYYCYDGSRDSDTRGVASLRKF
jgi:hypothetical protein